MGVNMKKEFKVGDRVIIFSCGGYETTIERVDLQGNELTNNPIYWSKAPDGKLVWCEDYEMEHVKTEK